MKNRVTYAGLIGSLQHGAAFLCMVVVGMLFATGNAAHAQVVTNSIFGPNVSIVTAGTSEADIESAMTALSNEAQFSTNRYAILFQPGTYTVQAPIGYYESVAGLSENPNGVVINGFITPNFGSDGPAISDTTNFWRSLENMSIVAATDSNQNAGANMLQWGVSQGTSFRRMNVTGGLELSDSGCGSASGGFMADTAVSGTVASCSQQQWYTRNSSIGSWNGGKWNMVFSGVIGAPTANYPTNSYTVLSKTPVSREKPFLYVDGSGNYWVFSPSVQTASSGTSWNASSPGNGTSLPISSFLIATPATPLATINSWLATAGQNLLLTPGIYQYPGAIDVVNADTVVLGMGFATVVPQTGTAAITVADVDGVQIAGLLIDAGPVNSPVLMEVGSGSNTGIRHNADPTSISDVYFRVGGSTLGTATVTLQVDSDDVILDNIWAWRADHGNAGTTGWFTNTATNGLVVNGDYVLATGLAVEHYQGAQVQWNGNYGETIFYQSELPYDPPSQAAWMDGAANGYPSYNVAADVTNHTTYGMGVYSNFDQGVNITDDTAISVPNVAGVTATDSVSAFLTGNGQITHTIDNAGTTVQSGAVTSYVPFYQGAACTTTCPVAPTSLTATLFYPAGSSVPQINLAWSAGTTPNTSYIIYRGTTSGFTPSVSNQIVAGLAGTTATYTDTAVAAGVNYYYYVQAQTAGGTSLSNEAGAGVPVTGGLITNDVEAINLHDTTAVPGWTADAGNGGACPNAGNEPSDLNVTIPAGLVNAAPVEVYKTMDNDSAGTGGVLTCPIGGLTAGQTYIVDLHFDEDSFTTAGSRVFNVAINGNPVLNNFDIEAAAGGAHIANVQSFTAIADGSGTLTIALTNVVNNALISGIEIGTGTIYGSPSGPNPPSQPTELVAKAISSAEVDLSWSASATANVSYNLFRSTTSGFTPAAANKLATGLTSTTYADTTVASGTTYYYIVQALASDGVSTMNSSQAGVTTPYSGGVITSDVIDIDAGYNLTEDPVAAPFAGYYGVDWQLDTDYVGGGYEGDGTTVTIPASTTNAAPLAVYQTMHNGPATYTIPGLAANTTYIVDLHFDEDYYATAGNRVFNVAINGAPVLTHFDIAAAAGGAHIANVQSFTATSDNTGTITVAITNVVNNALISGIEIGTGTLYSALAVPTVVAKSASTAYNTATAIDLSSSITGTDITAVTATTPAHGTVSVSGETVTYTPSSTYYGGSDSFTYTATNPGGTSTSATVTITVGAPATPTVVAKSASTAYNTATAIDLSSSITGTDITAVTATTPAHGTVSVSGEVVTYTPSSTYYGGSDSFTYTATNPGGTSTSATVTITVGAPATPTVVAKSASTAYNTATAIDLSSSITGTDITAVTATTPAHGTVSVSGETVTYTPSSTYYGGSDSFTYTATNPGGTSTSATVTITVGAPATPTVVAKSASTAYNTATAIDLSSSITGTDITAVTATTPAHGTVSVSGETVTYTPSSTYYGGSDSFTYTATNPGGTSTSATVTITVGAPATPTVVAKSASTAYNTTTAIDLSSSITGTDITAVTATTPAHGTVSVSGEVVTYTPSSTYYGGSDSFTYTATNPGGTSTSATVTITVGAPATPTVVAKSASTAYNTATAIDLSSSITGTDITAVTATTPAHGTVSVSGETVTYTPSSTYYGGSDSFTYTATNPGGTSTSATVTITVGAPPSPNAPTVVSATAGNTQATVTFTAPVSNSAAAITGYTATSSGGITANGTASPITVTGLTNGTGYTFTVTATNAATLTSLPSTQSNLVTPIGPQTIMFANPGAQTYGTASTLSATSTSNLVVAFTSATTSVCTISSGGHLTTDMAGICTINTNQAGNSAFTAATQVSQTFAVTQAASAVVLMTSATNITPVQSVTLSATATDVSSGSSGTPTGSISFYDGGTLLAKLSLSGGGASYTTTLAPGMAHALSASYGGDTNFIGSTTTSSVAVTVAPLDFTFTNTGTSAYTAAPGATATYSFTMAPEYGSYASPLSFTVTGLPAGATATFTPHTVASTAGVTPVILTVQTAAAIAHNSKNPLGRGIVFALLLLPFGLKRRLRKKLKSRMLLLLLLLTVSTAAMSGCGSSNGFLLQNQQSYSLTVTATSGTLVHSQTVTLIVQ